MEKITKEELLEEMKMKALSDEDLDEVSGGGSYDPEMVYNKCVKRCLETASLAECEAKCR